MKIGYDAKRIVRNGTGLGSYSRTLINSLAAIDHNDEFLLYAPDQGKDELRNQIEFHENVIFKYPNGTNGKCSSSIFSKIKAGLWRSKGVVKDLKRDGVEIYHGLSGELPIGLKKAGIKSVMTIHDLIFLRHPEYYHWIDVQLYKRKFYQSVKEADRIVAISECTKRDILHYSDFPADKIDVIYQSCGTRFKVTVSEEQIQEIKIKYNLPDTYILNVGTIEERKNVYLAILALEKLPKDFHIVIVGRKTKYYRDIMKRIQGKSYASRVHFLSGVPNNDLYAIYQQAQCFVYPSRYEGFGIPIIEAIQSGLPVVAASGSCLEEAGGEACLYVDPDDVEGMKNAILYCIEHREALNRASPEYVRRFENSDVATQISNVYISL